MSHYKNYYLLANDYRKGESVTDFEILQRCQRPQYATQLHWYHRYHRWKTSWQDVATPFVLSRTTRDGPKNQVSPLSEDMKLADQHHPSKTRSEVVDTDQLQIPNQQVLRAAISDFQSKLFIKRVKQMEKVWDLIMLLIAVYHLVITPFKVYFSHEVTKITEGVLDTWSGLEIFLDALSLRCLLQNLSRLPQLQRPCDRVDRYPVFVYLQLGTAC